MPHSRFDLSEHGREAAGRLLAGADWLRENPEKATRYAIMFVALVAIYAVYLVDFLRAGQQGSLDADEMLGAGRIARFVVFAGWPFALMRLLAPRWTSRDAAQVALAAYGVAAAIWLHRYGLNACMLGLTMLFAPLVFSAGIGHALGCLRPVAAATAGPQPRRAAADAGSVQTRSWESLMDDPR